MRLPVLPDVRFCYVHRQSSHTRRCRSCPCDGPVHVDVGNAMAALLHTCLGQCDTLGRWIRCVLAPLYTSHTQGRADGNMSAHPGVYAVLMVLLRPFGWGSDRDPSW